MLLESDLVKIRPFMFMKAKIILPCMAEDLVQETQIYMWEERMYYDKSTSLHQWTTRVMYSMRNCMIDLYKLKFT